MISEELQMPLRMAGRLASLPDFDWLVRNRHQDLVAAYRNIALVAKIFARIRGEKRQTGQGTASPVAL